MASTWIDFQALKRTISLQMALDHYGIQLRSAGSEKLRGHCPLPMHGSEKSNASFTATLDKGAGGVWACQSRSCVAARENKKGGGVLEFVAAMERCTIREAAENLADWFSVQGSDPHTAPRNATKPVRKSELVSEQETNAMERNAPLGFQLQGLEHNHLYLAGRGMTEAQAREFGIGYFTGRGTMHGRIAIPIHNGEGELVGYAGRAIDGSEPKYKFPAGFHKSVELYNLHRVIVQGRRRVVVVEGFFDCLKVSAAGFPCVALMGCSMSAEQEELLVRHFKAAHLLFDGDEAGQKALAEALTRLGSRMWVYAPQTMAGGQPDELSIEEIKTLLQ